jgi:glutathione S-transferase
MRLFYSPGACSLATHILLRECGATFDLVAVPVREGANLLPEYLAVNPRARVPALEVGGQIITENSALLAWLALSFPQAGLLPPPGSADLARVLEWLAWLASGLHVSFGLLWRPRRSVADETLFPAVQAEGEAAIRRQFAEIEQRLSHPGKWVIGDMYTPADASLLVFYRWGRNLGWPMQQLYPNWSRRMRAVLERPAVQAAFAAEGLAPLESEA